MRRSVLGLAMLLAASAAAEGKSLNELKAVTLTSTVTGTRIVVEGSQVPAFTVFRLNGPDRLVVDITGAQTKAIVGHHDGAGPVTGIVASQFSDARAEVGRVLVGLNGAARYDVHAEQTRLIISVDSAVAPKAAVVAEVAPPVPAEPVAVAPKPQASTGEANVVAARVDEKQVKRPATILRAVTFKRNAVQILADGEFAKFELIELERPGRLAIDFYGVSRNRVKGPALSGGLVTDVRLGDWENKARVVIEVRGEMPGYKALRRSNGLELRLDPKARPAVAARAGDEAAPEILIDGKSVLETAPAVAEVAAVRVTGVDFKEANGANRVEIGLSGKARWRVERPDARSAVLTIEQASVARSLERSLDTSELAGPVKMVSTFGVPGAQERVRIVAAGGGAMNESVVETSAGLSWRFKAKGIETDAARTEASTAGFSTEASQVAEEGAPRARRYVGKKVSFEFKDIDIHNLLRIIAEISKRNIVVADDVTGKVTVRLRNVPWDQALDLVLRSKSLGMEQFGNIIRVAPLATLETESKARAERKKTERLSKDLAVQLVPVNYATAGDMASRVKEVLTERGNVTVDNRTNTLIVRDLPENMGRVRSLVASLDTQTPQVLIESRIVEANTRYSREVGVQWGGQGLATPGTGNQTGLVFPNSVALTGGVVSTINSGVTALPNYAVSLPVGAGDGAGGALGMVFGSAGGAVQLNLRLSALEAQGALKTISAPKVTTLDNELARISQGLSIPFSQVSAAGVNTTFVQAVLSLEVTPHITQDGSVLMKINAQNNQPDPANTGANGQPAIQRKEANTNVLVKDGDTTVIGGIYVKAGSTSQAGLPILSQIPVIGFFFRNYRELETKNELLIFITPRILNRQAVAQNIQ